MEESNHRIPQNVNTYERYRLLVEQVKDYAIFMLDENGYIISWNEGAKKIKGYTTDEILGKHFSIFYVGDEAQTKPAMELEIAKEQGKFEEEGWRVRKDGSRFWASLVITAIYNDKQELIGFSKVTRDLTERRQAEQALRESEERYRSLTVQLNQTVQELAAANEELERFNTIASHDLQEPLRTTYSYLLLIQQKLETEGTPELQNYIQRAILGSVRMKDLIVSLLNYALLNTEERIFSLVPVKDIISESLQNLKYSIDEANAVITVEEKTSIIKGNKIHLIQLLQNLVGNALKFKGDKRPEIKITCTEETDHYKFAVADNGIGIAADHIPKVFEVFKRLHTDKQYAGTGIGLAICKKIVDYHAGAIWLESELGEGTTFFFTIDKHLPVK